MRPHGCGITRITLLHEEFCPMGQVSAASTILIDATPDAVLSAVADYEGVRPKILSHHYSDYQVLQGGQGAGTVVKWKLQATESRVRDVQSAVDVAGRTVIERDANSSMVTNWTVAPAGPGSSVTVKTSWKGAGGVKGFFEKTFAPLGLKKIQAEVLANLKKQVEG
jgi:carbon monoxide dehydrogenase subunit G